MRSLIKQYPFNLAKVIFKGNEEEALNISAIKLIRMINTLDSMEKNIIIGKYKENRTFKDIGELYELTGSRISQLHARAITKLSHRTRLKSIVNVDIEVHEEVLDKLRDCQKSLAEIMIKYSDADIVYIDADLLMIEDLGLSVRSYNCLSRRGVTNLSGILELGSDNIKKTRNLGTKAYNEIEQTVARLGYTITSTGYELI